MPFSIFKHKSVGGDISYVVPTKLKSGGTRPPRPPPIYAHAPQQCVRLLYAYTYNLNSEYNEEVPGY